MKRSAPLAALAALALLSIPASARADDAEKEKPVEAPDGAALEMRYPPPAARFKLLTAGVLLTGGAWGVSFAAAQGWPEQPCILTPAGYVYANNKQLLCTSGPPGSASLKIPVAGPWIALGKSGCAVDETSPCAAKIGVRAALLVLDGIVQLGGLALIAEAIIMKTESSAPAPAKKDSALALRFSSRHVNVELTPVPVVSSTMSGMGLVGTF